MKRETLLDLNEALQNPGKKLLFAVSTELENEEDLDLLEPLAGEIEAISTGNLLLLTSNLQTILVTECARCGTPINLDLKFKMEDQFDVEGVPSCYASDGYAHVVSDEPYPVFQGNNLIRDTYLRQGLLLNIPLQPLCTQSWDEECANAPAVREEPMESGHPAMQALQKLRHDEEGE